MNTKGRKREQGFTLIEIIAVLVILGILAAVAVPKYFDMQKDAQEKAVQGAIAAAQSEIVMCYGKELLTGVNATTALTTCTSGATTMELGDFNATASGPTAEGDVTITITTGPDWFLNAEVTKTKTIDLLN